MTPERVKTLIESYGANPEAWPQEEREAAYALYTQSPELQERARGEQTLDDILREYDPMPYDKGMHLAERILTATPDKTNGFTVFARQGAMLALAASVAAVAFISFSLLRHTPEAPVSVAFNDWAWEEVLDETPGTVRDNALDDPLVLLLPETLAENDRIEIDL